MKRADINGSVFSKTNALLWKEWNEVRLFFGITLFVFLGLPLIGAAENVVAGRHFELDASPWVVVLGGVLAVFIGVGIVVRDLNGRLEEFWRSRPVTVAHWLVVKYLVGLAVVLAALTIPLLVELVASPRRGTLAGPQLILAWSPFLWAALYSLSFAIASLIRRGAHAAMLSISMLLLVYFLPQVIPPLRYLDINWVTEESRSPQTDRNGHLLAAYHRLPWTPWPIHYHAQQLQFVIGMMVLCLFGLAIAVVAARRDWRIRSGQRMIYWSIGGVLLLIFSSGAFQVASNLPLLQSADPQHWIDFVRTDGNHGVMTAQDAGAGGALSANMLRALRITQSGIEFGPTAHVDPTFALLKMVWNPKYDDVLYLPGVGERTGENFPRLATVTLRAGAGPASVQSFPNLAVPKESVGRAWWGAALIIWHNRLYLLGNKLLTFDLADPLKPRLLSVEKIDQGSFASIVQSWRLTSDSDGDVDSGTIPLPAIPQLPPRQRLELQSRSFQRVAMLTGDILVRIYKDHITTYHLDRLTEMDAVFRKLGRYDPSPMEQLFGTSVEDTAAANGLLFESLRNSELGGAHITVFDVTGPRPAPIAHFALPNESFFRNLCPLPDGRLLTDNGERLYLLGPPPRHK